MRAALIGLALAAMASAGVAGVARATPQRYGGRGQEQMDVQGNTPYDGRFVFIRLRYSYGGQALFKLC